MRDRYYTYRKANGRESVKLYATAAEAINAAKAEGINKGKVHAYDADTCNCVDWIFFNHTASPTGKANTAPETAGDDEAVGIALAGVRDAVLARDRIETPEGDNAAYAARRKASKAVGAARREAEAAGASSAEIREAVEVASQAARLGL